MYPKHEVETERRDTPELHVGNWYPTATKQASLPSSMDRNPEGSVELTLQRAGRGKCHTVLERSVFEVKCLSLAIAVSLITYSQPLMLFDRHVINQLVSNYA